MGLGIRSVTPVSCELGEGPIWSGTEAAVYWIDILGRRLHRAGADGDGADSWDLPSKPGCVALAADGLLLLGLTDGLVTLDPVTASLRSLRALEEDVPENRLNDGASDSRGRLWIGSLHDRGERMSGALYRVDPDLTVTTVLTGVGTSNGLGWSPADDTFYFTDSWTQTITAFDFDVEAGTVHNPRVFVRDDDCLPDGLTVDAEGHVWSAKWGGAKIVRYTPDGSIDRVLTLPVPHATSVTFGGPDLDVLYVSTARAGLSDSEIQQSPCAGKLLAIEGLGVQGMSPTPVPVRSSQG